MCCPSGYLEGGGLALWSLNLIIYAIAKSRSLPKSEMVFKSASGHSLGFTDVVSVMHELLIMAMCIQLIRSRSMHEQPLTKKINLHVTGTHRPS